MKLNKKQIIQKIEDNKHKIKKFKVKKIGLFGSYLNGKQTKKSDIDFLIEFEKVTADNFFELLFLLENIFRKKIDLVDINFIRKELKHVREEAEYVKI